MPKLPHIPVRLEPEQKEKLERIAKKHGLMTISAAIRFVVQHYQDYSDDETTKSEERSRP